MRGFGCQKVSCALLICYASALSDSFVSAVHFLASSCRRCNLACDIVVSNAKCCDCDGIEGCYHFIFPANYSIGQDNLGVSKIDFQQVGLSLPEPNKQNLVQWRPWTIDTYSESSTRRLCWFFFGEGAQLASNDEKPGCIALICFRV